MSKNHFLPFQINTTIFIVLNFSCKMAAGGHFGCPKHTFDGISGHFRSIRYFCFEKIRSIYNLNLCFKFWHNGCRRPFWMSEIHFRSHFWPFQMDMKLWGGDFWQNGCRRPFWMPHQTLIFMYNVLIRLVNCCNIDIVIHMHHYMSRWPTYVKHIYFIGGHFKFQDGWLNSINPVQLLVSLLDYFSHKINVCIRENQVSGSHEEWDMVNNHILWWPFWISRWLSELN